MQKNKGRKLNFRFATCLCLALIVAGCTESTPEIAPTAVVSGDEAIAQAYRNHTGGIFVESSGVVERILKDDTEGSRHQRFILRLDSGQTLMVAHNIDVAPRVDGLKAGELVLFKGMYEWNDKGGVIHWTHHDPGYQKPGGWLEYKGKKYQ